MQCTAEEVTMPRRAKWQRSLSTARADPLLRRVLVAAQHQTDGAQVTMLEKAQHYDRPVTGAQLVDGFVQQRARSARTAFGHGLETRSFRLPAFHDFDAGARCA